MDRDEVWHLHMRVTAANARPVEMVFKMWAENGAIHAKITPELRGKTFGRSFQSFSHDSISGMSRKTSTQGVGTERFHGEIIRKDGSVDKYIWINVGKWGGLAFDFAKDIDGADKRELDLGDVQRIDIYGPTRLVESGTLVRNVWARADITLHNGTAIRDVYLNLMGIGGAWKWCYKTDIGYGGDIDDKVKAVTFYVVSRSGK